jgi:hypothetical protein
MLDDKDDVPGGADVGVAEDGELPDLLEQLRAALAEGHLPVHRVLNASKLLLAPRHGRSVRCGRCQLGYLGSARKEGHFSDQSMLSKNDKYVASFKKSWQFRYRYNKNGCHM